MSNTVPAVPPTSLEEQALQGLGLQPVDGIALCANCDRPTMTWGIDTVSCQSGCRTHVIVERLAAIGRMASSPGLCTLVATWVDRLRANLRYQPGRRVAPGGALTDIGNGERFARRHGQNFRYCGAWRQWLVWTANRWVVDESGRASAAAKDTAVSIYAEASAATSDHATPAEIADHARRSENAHAIVRMLELARSEAGIPVLSADLDRDRYLLNVENGTVDLRSGELRPHRREDLITRLAPVVFEDSAEAPQWERFLEQIMAGKAELVEFLQRFVGYCLTGDIREQVLCFFHGGGANGKSTLLEVLKATLGGYAMQGPPGLLMARRHEAHPTEIASLFAARLVMCTEAGEGNRFDEVTLKQLTGGDTLTARRMREDFWQFEPTHKLVLCANHRPTVRGIDHAVWRRIRLVPFDVKFWRDDDPEHGPAELRADPALRDRLLEERSGILAWAIRGCLKWQREGLGASAIIREATDAYRREQDVVGRWLAERCETGVDGSRQGSSELYADFSSWCDTANEFVISAKLFAERLDAHGIEGRKSRGVMVRVGVRLRPDDAGGLRVI
jgi:putative DNA primase/helicase